jgi:hypothetical protein
MFSAICEANFPTLVPPYFCTSHRASGSIVFWCKLGGVPGGGRVSTEDSDGEEAEGEGVDGSDMASHTVDEPEYHKLKYPSQWPQAVLWVCVADHCDKEI